MRETETQSKERYEEEEEEFSEFDDDTKRFITNSLLLALSPDEGFPLAAHSLGDSIASVQMGFYKMLERAREKLPKSFAFWEMPEFFGYALVPSSFDISLGKLRSYDSYRFIYERLLGGASRPWLPSLYIAAATTPNVPTDISLRAVEKYLWESALGRDWHTLDPLFMPAFNASAPPLAGVKPAVIIAREEGTESRTVTIAALPDGSVRLQSSDHGPTAKRLYGNSDYEFWVDIPRDALTDLALVLLKDRFQGDLHAGQNLRTFCKQNGIKHDGGTWS